MIDLDSLIALVASHKWLAVSAIVIGAVCRILKTDMAGQWFRDLPPIAKRLLPLGLGIVSGVLDSMVSGKDPQSAILGGLMAAAVAILGHDIGIEGLRGGRELGEPK